MAIQLIADAGSTKTEWCVTGGRRLRRIMTAGISPYVMDAAAISALLRSEVLPRVGTVLPEHIYYYGTGCAQPARAAVVRQALRSVFRGSRIQVHHDLLGAARGLCGHDKGMVCILGTGSGTAYYNGRRIARERPGLGYVLGDEGSGACLGKSVLQHYLNGTFDPELNDRFESQFPDRRADILDAVYRQPAPNAYLARFTPFLSENRGHFMVENILEDAFNEFFFGHLCKFGESWRNPIHFTGSVAYAFRDVLAQACASYEFRMGRILSRPMEGLIHYHQT